MNEENRRAAFVSSYKQHRQGWSRSKFGNLNSSSLNSTTSSLWSCNTLSLTSDVSMEPYKSYEYELEQSDRKSSFTPTIIVDSPEIQSSYMTSSSSFMSSSQLSNDVMTSSHDNGPSSDISTPDGNIKAFPLSLRTEPIFSYRRSSDDEDFDETLQPKNLRLRRKPSPKRSMVKRNSNTMERMKYNSSAYPSSVTSSLPRSSSTDDAFSDRDKTSCSSKIDLADDVFNHNIESEKKLYCEKATEVITLQEDDILLAQNLNNYKADGTTSNAICCPECIQEQNNDNILFNVAGKFFEASVKVLESYPDTLLGNPGKRMQYYDWKRQEYFLDRHRDTFQVILDFYNNGGVLQRPDEIPIDIFINELKFYCLDRDTLEQFLRDEGILYVEKQKLFPNTRLKRYIWQLFEDHDSSILSKVITVVSALVITLSVIVFCLETLDNFKSLSHDAKEALAPSLNNCQSLSQNDTERHYAFEVGKLQTNHENHQLLHLKFKRNVDHEQVVKSSIIDNNRLTPILEVYSIHEITKAVKSELEECRQLLKDVKYKYTVARCLIELRDEKKKLKHVYGKVNVSIDSPNMTSTIATHLGTPLTQHTRHKQVNALTRLSNQENDHQDQNREVFFSTPSEEDSFLDHITPKLPLLASPDYRDELFLIMHQTCMILDTVSRKTPYEWFVLEALMGSPAGILFITETACIVWFVIELTLRFSCCPDKKKFVKSFLNMIDALAILPYFITLVVTTIETKTHVKPQTATILRTIRLVRMLRILKLSRYSRGFRILGLTLIRSTRVLFLLVCFQVVLAVLFSSMAYFMEYDAVGSQFRSIPESFWWALITMTTVGYGDVYPITVLGKFAGACCAIMGILCISFPVPVVVSNFNYLYNLDKEKFKLVPEDLMEDKEERLENADKFRDNLFSVMKKSASCLTDDRKSTNNPSETWNAAKKTYRKMSLASIDARLEKSPSRSISTTHSTTTPVRSVLHQSKRTHVRATSV